MTAHTFFFIILVVTAGAVLSSADKLSADFYSGKCPSLLPIVEKGIIKSIQSETRIGASLLRLHFHDCFVNGCDGSVLLDDTGSFTGEKTARPNNGSIRGFEVIDAIKAEVEQACPGVVSCADILTLAARDSVVQLGGPSWEVPLGRRDSKTASLSAANQFIPAPTLNLSGLISSFSVQGLSVTDLVSLSGAHTIGLARCVSFRSRAFNDIDIDASFAKSLQNKCPLGGNNNTLQPLDLNTPTCFDNSYFRNLLSKRGLLHSDQELFNGKSTDSLVQKYASDCQTFFNDFANAMINMGNIKPLTGNQGEIRINCRKVN